MVWTKAGSGTWTDDYDGAEKVFYAMSQAFKRHNREHGSVYAICRIRVGGPELPPPTGGRLAEQLKLAWTRLRFEFPSLAVFEAGGRKTYHAATAANIEAWLDDTFWVDDDGEAARTARQVVAGLHLRRLPCLVYVPRSSEVLFHCSHWRIDALGACMVLDRLFSVLAELHVKNTAPQALMASSMAQPRWEWGIEHENLSPSLEDAYGSATAPTRSTEATAQEVRRRNFDAAHPSAGLPYRGDLSTPPGASRCQTATLDRDATAQLIRACKARGCSVTAAVHAACAAAVFEVSASESDADDAYSAVVSVNLRPFLPHNNKDNNNGNNNGNGAAHSHTACGTYVTGITHTLRRRGGSDGSSEFDAWCQQLTRGYRGGGGGGPGGWDPPAYLDALRSIYRVHGEALAEVAASGDGRRRPASSVTVSSLGVVDDGRYLRAEYGGDGGGGGGVAVRVEAFHLGSAIMGRQPTLYIWTWGGCLTLSVDYNEAYYEAGQICGLLDGIRKCLGKEMGIDMTPAFAGDGL